MAHIRKDMSGPYYCSNQKPTIMKATNSPWAIFGWIYSSSQKKTETSPPEQQGPRTSRVNTSDREKDILNNMFYEAQSRFRPTPTSQGLNASHPNVLVQQLLPEDLVQEHENEFALRLESIREQKRTAVENVNAEITGQHLQLNEAMSQREEHESQLREAYKKRGTVLEKIRGIMEKLYGTVIDTGRKIASLQNDRIAEMQEQLGRMIDLSQTLENKQNKKSRADFAEEHERKAAQVQQLKAIKSGLEARYQRQQTSVDSMMQAGMNKKKAGLLIFFSFIAIISAGTFFSIWAEAENGTKARSLSGGDTITSILLNNFIGLASRYDLYELGGGVIIFVLIIWAVCYGVHRVRKSLSEENKMQEDWPDPGEDLLKAYYSSRSGLHFFLNFAPLFTTIALVLIVLARNAFLGGTDLARQFQAASDTSSNQTLGSFLAMLVSGLVIIAIVYGYEMKGRVIRLILWLSMFLFAVMLILMIVYKISHDFGQHTGLVALSGFAACCMVAGLFMGYAYRYRSLLESERLLHHRLRICEHLLQKAQFPSFTTYYEPGQMQEEMKKFLDKLFAQIHERVDDLAKLRQPPVYTRTSGMPQLSDAEKACFPEAEKQYAVLQHELENAESELREIDRAYETIYSRTGTYAMLCEREESIRTKIEALRSKKVAIIRQYDEELEIIRQEKMKERMLMKKGYLLGIWSMQRLSQHH
jgi:hypothetical protein